MLVGLLLTALLVAGCATPGATTLAAPSPVASPAPTLATPLPTPRPTPSPTASPSPSPTRRIVALSLDAGTVASIGSLIAASGGHAALVVADGPAGTILHEVAAEEVVLSASLYKLAVLLEAERRIDERTLRSTDRVTVTQEDQRDGGVSTPTGAVLSVEDALERTITLSDNSASLALVRLLGVDAIHATLDRYGLSGQRFRFEIVGGQLISRGSITTARTIASFFSQLARRALVSIAASERMLARLGRQKVNDRIPAALPAGAVIAHKTGNLGFVTHDAGLIKGPGGVPVVLVVLTWDSNERVRSQLIRDITAAVYEALTKP